MPRVCTVCTHPEKREIDEALLAGQPFRKVAQRFGTSTSALFRHKSNDIPLAMVKAQEVQEISYGGDLLAQVRDLNDRTLRILAQAEAAGDPRIALAAIREARSNSELLCRMMAHMEAHGGSAHDGPEIGPGSVQRVSELLFGRCGPERVGESLENEAFVGKPGAPDPDATKGHSSVTGATSSNEALLVDDRFSSVRGFMERCWNPLKSPSLDRVTDSQDWERLKRLLNQTCGDPRFSVSALAHAWTGFVIGDGASTDRQHPISYWCDRIEDFLES